MSLEIIHADKILTEVKFNDPTFFGEMEFGGIGKLNVITGPNGVGKSRLLTEIQAELSKDIWGEQNIYPVHLTFIADKVEKTYFEDKDGYNRVMEKVYSHNEYKERCNPLKDNFTVDRTDCDFIKHKKSYDRYVKVYEKETSDKQIELQMQYEFGMRHDDMQ